MTAIFQYREELWRANAACLYTDPNLFFPGKGDWKLIQQARAVCAECPVRAECLESAILRNERQGIYGGTTPKERAKIRRNRPDLPKSLGFRGRPPCGTVNGYKWHLRHPERGPVCDACRVENNLRRKFQAEAKAQRAAS